MTVNTGDVFRVAARMTQDDNDIVNVFHIGAKQATAVDDADFIDDLLDHLEDIYTHVAGVQPNTIAYADVKIDEVDYVGGKPTIIRNLGTHGWPTLTAGLSSTEQLPAQVSAVTSFRTINPKTIAKKFWGYMQEANWDGDSWSASMITALGSIITEMITDYVGTHATLENMVQSLNLGAYTPLLSGVARAYAGIQKRRKPGVGA